MPTPGSGVGALFWGAKREFTLSTRADRVEGPPNPCQNGWLPGSESMILKHGGAFVTKRWSRVLLSADTEDSEGCAALAELCRDYWHPLYHYCRRQGLDRLDAQDAT
jgi:hypothetical protein